MIVISALGRLIYFQQTVVHLRSTLQEHIRSKRILQECQTKPEKNELTPIASSAAIALQGREILECFFFLLAAMIAIFATRNMLTLGCYHVFGTSFSGRGDCWRRNESVVEEL